MSLILDNLRSSLRRTLGIAENDPKYTQNVIDLWLNRSYWEVQDKFDFREKEATMTFPSVVGERFYALPVAFEYIRSLSIKSADESGQHTPLDRMTTIDYETKYSETDSAFGYPTNYIREGCGFYLYPTPDAVYTLTIKYILTLGDLGDDNTTIPLPQVWHELVLWGAEWRGFRELGDYERMHDSLALYNAKIIEIEPIESKEEEDSRYAGAQPLRPSYELQ